MFNRRRKPMGCIMGMGALTNDDFDVAKTIIAQAGDATGAAAVDQMKAVYLVASDSQKLEIEDKLNKLKATVLAKQSQDIANTDAEKKKKVVKVAAIGGAAILVIALGMNVNAKNKKSGKK